MVSADALLTLASSSQSAIGASLTLILVLGVGAQWLAWRMRVPAILLLLIFGLLAGPVMRALFPNSGFALDPTALLSEDLLLALVGIGVGLILFEGGLTLRFSEVRGVHGIVLFLVTTGALVTWIIAGVAAYKIFGLSQQMAVLLGAVLIVTGPTVIGPMLNHIRPAGSVGPILKWEGIVIDPIGVIAAVLVFEAILIGGESTMPTLVGLTRMVVIGAGLGVLAAVLLLGVMSRFMVPDALQNPVSLMLVVATYTLSNIFQPESGLLATTVMGMVLANQKRIDVRHILEFKEILRVLLISALFIVLAARIETDDLLALNWLEVLAFLAVLIFIARPVSVALATIGSDLTWKERVFLATMAPRGIVAAAGASIFALGLAQQGIDDPGIHKLVPLTFAVIIGTVAFYGVVGPMVARVLGVSDQNPQGLLIVGAPRWARAIATVLHARGVQLLMVDTNRGNILAARMEGLAAARVNILDDKVLEQLDLRGIGRVLAVTANDEVNTLALQRFEDLFEKAGLFKLAPKSARHKDPDAAAQTHGRVLFDAHADYALLESRIASGWIVKATTLSDEFDMDDYNTLYGRAAMPMFIESAAGLLAIFSPDRTSTPAPGDTIIALVNPEELFMPIQPKDDEDDTGEQDTSPQR